MYKFTRRAFMRFLGGVIALFGTGFSWIACSRTGDSDADVLAKGSVGNLDTSTGGSNLIKVIAVGERGYLFINELFFFTLFYSEYNSV